MRGGREALPYPTGHATTQSYSISVTLKIMLESQFNETQEHQ